MKRNHQIHDTFAEYVLALAGINDACIAPSVFDRKYMVIDKFGFSRKWENYGGWFYYFSNKPSKFYRWTFDTIDDVIDSILKAREYCMSDGHVHVNPLYGKTREECKIMFDLHRST